MTSKNLKHLLIAEDDFVLKRFYQQALKGKCEQLTIVDSPDEAIKLLAKNKFDLLISDLEFSGKNGLDVIRVAMEYSSEIKVLVASGFVADAKYQGELMAISCIKGFLQKPFTLQELLDKIEAIL